MAATWPLWLTCACRRPYSSLCSINYLIHLLKASTLQTRSGHMHVCNDCNFALAVTQADAEPPVEGESALPLLDHAP